MDNKVKFPDFDSSKNWKEDYAHENGQYVCCCVKCETYFFGYKRRLVCKECDSILIEEKPISPKRLIQLQKVNIQKALEINENADVKAILEEHLLALDILENEIY